MNNFARHVDCIPGGVYLMLDPIVPHIGIRNFLKFISNPYGIGLHSDAVSTRFLLIRLDLGVHIIIV